MPALTHFDRQAPPGEILQSLRDDGACIIDSLIEEPEVKALRRELDPHIEATPNGRDEFTGHLTTRTGGLVVRSGACRDLVQHPVALRLCDDFLLEYCERYHLHLAQVIRIRPGESAQSLHRDRWAWGTHLAHVEPQLNTLWALTDFTAANGATRVVPGSTRWEEARKPQPEETARAEMSPGSVLFYTGSVFHSGGANTTEADRIGLNITYSLGWLRQEENQYLSVPPEHAKELDPELQRLIGYTMGQYALGYFTPPGEAGEPVQIQDPQQLLRTAGSDEGQESQQMLESLNDRIRETRKRE